jgi:hypothetical protein
MVCKARKTFPFENVLGSDQGFGKKRLNTGVADMQCCGAPAKFTLTTKPILTQLLFADIF